MKIVKLLSENWIQADGYRKNVMLNSDELKQKGSLAQIVVVGPGSKVKPHYHKKTYEIICVIEGQALVSVNDKSVITKPHDMILTEPNDVHSVENDGETDWKAIVFKTNAAEDDSYWPEIKTDEKT